jgi:hypothetical protein
MRLQIRQKDPDSDAVIAPSALSQSKKGNGLTSRAANAGGVANMPHSEKSIIPAEHLPSGGMQLLVPSRRWMH